MSDTVSAAEARQKLYPLIEEVNNDRNAIHITSKKGNAVLVSEDEWNSMQETLYLLRSPVNATRLTEGIRQAEAGETIEVSMSELRKLVGE
ncbi:MAG: type II toxin-antitoxin system Phd/YefM family antitoxin [Mycobacteriaceae bacterium]|nr:type II toxin-antitoxin system Phd/YefM family antitoxin [Mycobacteriaceae bacterium]